MISYMQKLKRNKAKLTEYDDSCNRLRKWEEMEDIAQRAHFQFLR